MLMPVLSPKKLSIQLPRETITLALYPGTSCQALQVTVAGRVGLPPVYHDGSASFYLTHGNAADGLIVPLDADGLPDGVVLTLHINPAPVGTANGTTPNQNGAPDKTTPRGPPPSQQALDDKTLADHAHAAAVRLQANLRGAVVRMRMQRAIHLVIAGEPTSRTY